MPKKSSVKKQPTRPLALTKDELKPLYSLCRLGRVLEVQQWIWDGKPIDLQPVEGKNDAEIASPLRLAAKLGSYSLVQLFLQAGAFVDPSSWFSPVRDAIRIRRLDLIELFVSHGVDPTKLPMREAVLTWNPKIIEYCIAQGADVDTDNPFTTAFFEGIFTANRPFKQLLKTNPKIIQQANIALRYFTKKWDVDGINRMLCLGANPHQPGTMQEDMEYTDRYDTYSALELAAMDYHFEIFEMKKVKLNPHDPCIQRCIAYLCQQYQMPIIRSLFKLGLNPNDKVTGGCAAINHLLFCMHFPELGSNEEDRPLVRFGISTTKRLFEGIELIAQYGGKWIPTHKASHERRGFFLMSPLCAVEFIKIMWEYNACSREAVEMLVKPQSIRGHLYDHMDKVSKFLRTWGKSRK